MIQDRWLKGTCLIWFGMSLGVGLSAMFRFQTASLDRATALDVGRTVFGAFNKVELATAVACLVLALLSMPERRTWLILLLPCLVLAPQTLWLIPSLDSRATVVLAGGNPSPSPVHALYMALEAFKLACLFVVGLGLPPAIASREPTTADDLSSEAHQATVAPPIETPDSEEKPNSESPLADP